MIRLPLILKKVKGQMFSHLAFYFFFTHHSPLTPHLYHSVVVFTALSITKIILALCAFVSSLVEGAAASLVFNFFKVYKAEAFDTSSAGELGAISCAVPFTKAVCKYCLYTFTLPFISASNIPFTRSF